MLKLSFNPPLGDAVSVPYSSLFVQGTPLLFTATLGGQDYEKLVQRGGRVQLWSDIPRRDGGNSKGWAELDFEDLAIPSLGINAVTLKGKSPIQNSATKTLGLFLSLPRSSPGVSFSFTYRITYTSGRVEWLGAFGQNGTITMQQSQSTTILDAFQLPTGWRYDETKHIHLYETKGSVESLEVAKLVDASTFRVVGLSSSSFVPNSKNASMFFLVPLLQRHPLVIVPTLIVAASHEITLNLSENGSLTASGNGSIILQINNVHSDVNANIGPILSHSKLDNWEILPSNSNSATLTLAQTRSNEAIHVVTIPLWPSKYIPSSLLLNLGQLGLLSSRRDKIESALFFPGEKQLHVLNKDIKENKDTLLQTQPTDHGFIISPIHRLPIYPTTGRNMRRSWGVAILVPYNRILSPFKEDPTVLSEVPIPPLLTPSLEESIADIISPSSSSSSNATTLCSMTSISPDVGASGNTKTDLVIDDVVTKQQRTGSGDTDAIVPSKALTGGQPQTTRDALSLFRSIFASVTAFARLLFDVLLCPALSFGNIWFHRTATPVEPEPEDDEPVGELLEDEFHVVSLPENSHVGRPRNASEGSVRIGPESIPEDERRDASQDIDASGYTLLEDQKATTFSGQLKDIKVDPEFLGGLDRSSSAEMVYAEVFGKEVTGRIAIAFLPPLATDADNSDVTNTIQSNDLEETLKGTVKFLDGSPPPPCSFSRIERTNLFSPCERLPGTEHSHDICFLLEYDVDREDGSKVRLISISSPPDPFV